MRQTTHERKLIRKCLIQYRITRNYTSDCNLTKSIIKTCDKAELDSLKIYVISMKEVKN
jgi:hypothetical protein